jgi:anaerobic magnesium-protoporphyrin IX monomethyl ester cyclase
VICDLVEHLEGKRPLAEVAGCWYRDAAGVPAMTRGLVREKDIDQIPWPAWDLVPIETYLSGGHGWGVDRGRNMPMNATRGCPYQCTFCSSPTMWTTRWVARSPEDVVAEIKHYMARYGATNFDFQDLTAIIRKDWVIAFSNLLLKENLNITWQLPSGTRSEALDAEVLPLLVKSGCTNITYAPESGTEEILKRIKKKIRTDRMLASMRQAVKAGCNVKANFIFGFPEDTYRSLLPTFWFLVKMAVVGVHDISIAPFRPYPGSELFRDLQKAGKIADPLDDEYYRRLATTSENLPGATREPESFCFNMSGHGLDRMRIAALLTFFLISWLVRPVRVLRLVRALITEKQDSRLDKSLIEMKRRVMKRRRREPSLALGEVNPY